MEEAGGRQQLAADLLDPENNFRSVRELPPILNNQAEVPFAECARARDIKSRRAIA
jgi:hypothetical protein